MNVIGIVTHGDAIHLRRLIESIRDTTDYHPDTYSPSYSFYVLGQGLTPLGEKNLENCRTLDGEYRYSFQNLMAIGGRQRIIDRVYHILKPTEFIIFLDDDVVCTQPGWFETLIYTAHEYGIASQVAVNIRPDWEDFEEPPEGEPRLMDVAGGGTTCVSGRVIYSGVEYDQSFLPFWHADSDFSLQARSKGFQVWWTGDIGLQHEHNNKHHDFYWKRNFLKLKNKWSGKGLVHFEKDQPSPT